MCDILFHSCRAFGTAREFNVRSIGKDGGMYLPSPDGSEAFSGRVSCCCSEFERLILKVSGLTTH